MTLYFAYGSNMSRALMGTHCPSAEPVGTARLDRHRFLITADGYASVEPRAGASVHGVVWRLSPRDIAALNVYEAVDSGLYRVDTLPVRMEARIVPAMIYVGRTRREGVPRPGYMDLVLRAAREWDLPADYLTALARWSPSRPGVARAPGSGEFA